MKFLVDAQLPRRLATKLRDAGHDVLHTLDLQHQNRTSDSGINLISMEEHRVVVTKDADFVTSLYLQNQPYKLLLISTGNIGNADLEALLLPNIALIESILEDSDFVEVTSTSIIVHK